MIKRQVLKVRYKSGELLSTISYFIYEKDGIKLFVHIPTPYIRLKHWWTVSEYTTGGHICTIEGTFREALVNAV